MRARLLSLLALALAACSLRIDYAGSAYRCDDGACPDGFVCSPSLTCVSIGGDLPDAAADDADATADAADAMADAADATPGIPDATPGPPDAAPATCNHDGTVQAGEQCDDGNSVDTDACRNNCHWATCGDGVVRTSVEECDDGNTANGDTCSETCQRCTGGVTDPDNGHCYKWGSAAEEWWSGVDTCVGMGGYLASLTDAAEVAFARAHAPEVPYWIGLNDTDVEGQYVWYDGEPAGTPLWSINQPNGSNDNNDCVWAESSAGRFNDLGCTSATTARSLCEIEGWHVRPSDGHAYRFVDALSSASVLEGDCEGLGGTLASVDTTAEASFLATLATGSFWIGPPGSFSNCRRLDLAAGSGSTTSASCWQNLFGVCEIP